MTDDTGAGALLRAWFTDQGLGTLGDWAWTKYQNGESPDQIMQEVRQTPEYKARFPAMEQLVKSGRGITEAEYRAYEQTVRTTTQQWGLPTGMYDQPDQVAKLLLNNVSASEFNSRIQVAAAAAYTAPESVRTALTGMGVNPGGIIAYFADSNRSLPLLTQQYNAAQVVGAGLDQGVGVSNAQAMEIAARSPGITYDQANQNLATVASQRGLSKGFGETADTAELVGAQFGNAAAAAKTARVQRGRLVQYGAAGSLAEGSTGVSGLASSKGA